MRRVMVAVLVLLETRKNKSLLAKKEIFKL